MNRREFLAVGAAGGATLATGSALASVQPAGGRFRFACAPHFGMFRHHAGSDPLDQIRFLAEAGFTALEDDWLSHRSQCVQEQIGEELQRHGMTMGTFVATADFGRPTFASGRPDLRRRVLKDMHNAVTVAQQTGARWCIVIPGTVDNRLPFGRQTVHAVDMFRRCVEICGRRGLGLLLQPVSAPTKRPPMFLRSGQQAAALCRTVGSSACKVLWDCYDERTRGNDPVASVTAIRDLLGYVRLGDSPGRKEPGTGDIDFRAVFRSLRQMGFNGIAGMDHGNSRAGKEGERAVIEAYRKYDAA